MGRVGVRVGVGVGVRLELVGRRLGPDVHAREVAIEQVLDEGGLARRVLPHEQHHRLGVPVTVVEQRLVEDMREVLLLEVADLLTVDLLHALEDAVVRVDVELRLLPTEDPHGASSAGTSRLPTLPTHLRR